MSNIIQIKRSETTATPAALANGELAWSSNSNVLFIGDFGSVLAVGGERTPGVLTANQALVANSTSGIDKVVVANLVPTAIYANGTFGSANQVLRTDGSGVYWADDVGDVSEVVAGDGLTGGGSGGAVTLNVAGANGINVTSDTVGVTTGSTLTVNSTGIHVNSALSITDLTLAGNLTVSGTLTTIDTQNLTIQDPMIELANGNVSTDSLDIGFYGQYGETGTKYTGLFRDATDGVYKFYTGLEAEPTTTVDTAANGFAFGTLQSYLISGGLISNTTAVTLTANSTLAVNLTANTLSLTTPLATSSGGTGKSSFTAQALLVGNNGGTMTELTLGASGKVLQSNGTAVVYADLDGGTF